MGGAGGKVFTPTPKVYRVKCNLAFEEAKVALALRRILRAFEVSAVKAGWKDD